MSDLLSRLRKIASRLLPTTDECRGDYQTIVDAIVEIERLRWVVKELQQLAEKEAKRD